MIHQRPLKVSLSLNPGRPPQIVGADKMSLLFLTKRNKLFSGVAIAENNQALLNNSHWKDAGLKIVEGEADNLRMADAHLAIKIGEKNWLVYGLNSYLCRTENGYYRNSKLLQETEIIIAF